jgi:hypothetical protein
MNDSILSRMETILDTMRVYCDQVRLDLRMAMHVRRQMVNLFDTWLKEKDDSRRRVALEALKNRAEKEVGPWFWRRRKGVSLEDDLKARVSQLKDMGYDLDWQWDLTLEALTDWTGEADEELLKKIFLEAHNASAK